MPPTLGRCRRVSRPRWGTGQAYQLWDLSLFAAFVGVVLYIVTPPTYVGAGSTVVPGEVLTALGVGAGATQTILGAVVVGGALIAAATSWVPTWLTRGYRTLFAVTFFWGLMLLAGVVLAGAPERNLVTVAFFWLVASHTARFMPNAEGTPDA